MAGIEGVSFGFRPDANVRIHKFTAMVKSSVQTTTQTEEYAAVPSASNASGFIGFTTEHFIEPPPIYNVGLQVAIPGGYTAPPGGGTCTPLAPVEVGATSTSPYTPGSVAATVAKAT